MNFKMKHLLFSSYSLGMGGIEKALVTLLQNISGKYDITLVLEKREGIFLDELPRNIRIFTYSPSSCKLILLRKVINFLKQLDFKMKYKNNFDFSVCYSTYSYPCSFVARTSSENSCLWVHNDYMNFFSNDEKEYKKFFEKLKVNEYKKIVFVSYHDRAEFIKIFPEMFKTSKIHRN